jgi:hypothetical protein
MRWPAGFDSQDVVTPFPARSPDSIAVSPLRRRSCEDTDCDVQYETEPLYDERLSELLKGHNKGVFSGIPIWCVPLDSALRELVLTRRFTGQCWSEL